MRHGCDFPMPRERRFPHTPRLSVPLILAWADEHFMRTGEWPKLHSGDVIGTLTENWRSIDNALRYGLRGIKERITLADLLVQHQRHGKVASADGDLTFGKIFDWADQHYRQLGKWPTVRSRIVSNALHERWSTIDEALQHGSRGLPGGLSLSKLLRSRKPPTDA